MNYLLCAKHDGIFTPKQYTAYQASLGFGAVFYTGFLILGCINMTLMCKYSRGRKQNWLMWTFYLSAQAMLAARNIQYLYMMYHVYDMNLPEKTVCQPDYVQYFLSFCQEQVICSFLKFVVGNIEWIQLMDLYFKMDVLLVNKNKDDVTKKTRYASAFAFILIIS